MQSKGKKKKLLLEVYGWILTKERFVEKENTAGIEEGNDLQRK